MENEILKIQEFLKSKGWACSTEAGNSIYKKSIEKGILSQTIVNGQIVNAEPNIVNYTIVEWGTGSVEDIPVYGYIVSMNDETEMTIYVYDLQDFIQQIYSTIE